MMTAESRAGEFRSRVQDRLPETTSAFLTLTHLGWALDLKAHKQDLFKEGNGEN